MALALVYEKIVQEFGPLKGGNIHCPAVEHQDRHPSCTITDRPGQLPLLHCKTGCSQQDVIDGVKAAGLDWLASNGSTAPIESWTWTTTDGRRREQHRWPSGKKWEVTTPPNTPAPRDLMYVPVALPVEGIVILAEGASDTDALVGAELAAVGRTNVSRPSRASIERLPKQCEFLIFPDHDGLDKRHSGYQQALSWLAALTRAGRKVQVVDPLQLDPDAPSGYDARDWVRQESEPTLDKLRAAVVAPDVLRERIQTPTLVEEPPDAVHGLADVVPLDQARLCISENSLAELVYRHAGPRLRYIRDKGSWTRWREGRGWSAVDRAALLKAMMRCGEVNIGRMTEDGPKMDPRGGGRRTTAEGALAGLQGLCGTGADEWDQDGHLVGIPGGLVLDLQTGKRTPITPTTLIRRSLPAAPASAAQYERSRWREVIEHVIPDDQEREYFKRRMGAALMHVEGLDDAIWLFGAPGCGKGVSVQALFAAFGDYAASLPVGELTAGGRAGGGHLQWKFRLRDCRLMLLDDAPNRNLDPGVITELLGSVVTANPMRQGSVDFRIHAPLVVTANQPPSLTAASGAVKRRLKPIECGAPIPEAEQDETVRASMCRPRELAAVIYWLVAGAQGYTGGRCPVPDSIRGRAASIMDETPMSEFVEQFDNGAWLSSAEAWERWTGFCRDRNMRPGGRKTFVTRLARAYGWQQERTKKTRGFRVVTLVTLPKCESHARDNRSHETQ